MIQFAAVGMEVVKGLVGAFGEAVEDPDTYKKIEAIRSFLSELTGKEIDQNGLVALLEATTQGQPYTGKWEYLDKSATGTAHSSRRLRVAGGWLYQAGLSTPPVFVPDK